MHGIWLDLEYSSREEERAHGERSNQDQVNELLTAGDKDGIDIGRIRDLVYEEYQVCGLPDNDTRM